MKKLSAALWTGCLLALATPAPAAQAFCGFYVTGADTSLYANATMAVLMRDGTRTVLSMQNNYQGPPEDFAMVIPVPTVLTKDSVKTLPREVFSRVDTLAAPRLVEYWEGDPCMVRREEAIAFATGGAPTAAAADSATVKVEAQFAVGEYDVVILSASDSTGLETWLHDNKYNIPSGANEVLAPYVSSGTKFFVAKVDSSRVTFEKGQAVLSPLRFHYDTPELSLPVRLGLLNSQGTQDLIVSILAPTRYEAANHPNVLIPTNIRVQNDVRSAFPEFYEALFSKVVEKNPGAVVTEYSWSASSCDPCPTPPLSPEDIMTLGGDVMAQGQNNNAQIGVGAASGFYTLTRLHYRYTKDTLGEDLIFKAASGVVGGRGVPDVEGKLPQVEPMQGSESSFQGRYVILHPWEEKVTCQNPVRGQWGGPGDPKRQPVTMASSNTALTGAPAKGSASLASLVAEPIMSLDLTPTAAKPTDKSAAGSGGSSAPTAANMVAPGTVNPGSTPPKAPATDTRIAQAGTAAPTSKTEVAAPDAGMTPATETSSGCSCQLTGAGHTPGPLALLAFAPVAWLARRRRGRSG